MTGVKEPSSTGVFIPSPEWQRRVLTHMFTNFFTRLQVDPIEEVLADPTGPPSREGRRMVWPD